MACFLNLEAVRVVCGILRKEIVNTKTQLRNCIIAVYTAIFIYIVCRYNTMKKTDRSPQSTLLFPSTTA